MSAFTVELENQPGELARLCEAMAGSGVNLLLCAAAHGDRGVVALIADGEASAQTLLDSAGLEYAMRPALTVRVENLPRHSCGGLPQARRRRGQRDLLLPARYSGELFFAVICVDDVDAARSALGEQVVTG